MPSLKSRRWKTLHQMSDDSLTAYITTCQARINRALQQWLPPERTQPVQLHQAMRYAALGQGKRIRPTLVYATAKALNIMPSRVDAPAVAVELIHAYSLVHDDLPAMDDDDLRRGQPTCHKAFDEATAILAGDALQTLAFRILSHYCHEDIPAHTRLQMIDALALASGSRGMAGGQAIDMESVGKDLQLVELENMHIHKTGALIRASIQLGLLPASDVSDDQKAKLDHYGKCIGLAFQVRDDILDIEGHSDTIGKTQGKDVANEKPTYPQLLGLAGAKEKNAELHEDALAALSGFDEKADTLRAIANFIVGRNR